MADLRLTVLADDPAKRPRRVDDTMYLLLTGAGGRIEQRWQVRPDLDSPAGRPAARPLFEPASRH
jgi:hypothetical protein